MVTKRYLFTRGIRGFVSKDFIWCAFILNWRNQQVEVHSVLRDLVKVGIAGSRVALSEKFTDQLEGFTET